MPAQEQSISSLLSGYSADLACAETEMFRIQLEINRLIKGMENLVEVKKEIRDDVARCRYLLTPIRLLPLEILVEIFKYTIVQESNRLYPHINQAPISISQVCSTWRKASLQCPTLWSTLSLWPSGDYYKSNLTSGILNWWYGRAERQPLSFSFSELSSSIRSIRSVTKEIVAALIPFSHRLSNLQLHINRFDDIAPFLSQRDVEMPFLETLAISTSKEPRLSSNVHVFRSAPALRDVTLGLSIYPDILGQPLSFEFPWAQLTRLTIKDLTPYAFHHIITQCYQLVNGSFKIDLGLPSDLETPQESAQPITLAYLSTFRLKISDIDNVGIGVVDNILSKLVLTSLKCLELCAMDINHEPSLPSTISSLHNTLTPSTVLLTHLVLINACHKINQLSAMLRVCNMLETFAFQSNNSCAELIFGALLKPTDGSPVPSLPSLTSFFLVIEPRDLELLPERLSTLVHKWASNPMRRRPLELITVYDYDEIYRETDDVVLVFSEMRQLLGPWTKTGGYEAVAESGMVLITEMVYHPFDLSEELGRLQERSEGL
ncbi:hypothetical protein H0H81_012749 [Sphagnurus paluster]|uniref:F-box domain-containing protein n=1 Tax=Sphagnurus paluster TaxID=117069 RepID=A0A9P7FXZ8_9AGAR|nr:hypothetical protein H0H81_012749 [Sphagnurus paluster]